MGCGHREALPSPLVLITGLPARGITCCSLVHSFAAAPVPGWLDRNELPDKLIEI